MRVENDLSPTVGKRTDGTSVLRWDPVQPCTGLYKLYCSDCKSRFSVDEQDMEFETIDDSRREKTGPCPRCGSPRIVIKSIPTCLIRDDCSYKKVGRCLVEVKYLNAVFDPFLDEKEGLGDQWTPLDLQRIGFHLLPLYQQLIKLKKEAFAVRKGTYEDSRGVIRINPLYREMREIIRQIDFEIDALKFSEKWDHKFGEKSAGEGELGRTRGKPHKEGPTMAELRKDGLAGYHRALEKTGDKK